jgi:hypothetical protein
MITLNGLQRGWARSKCRLFYIPRRRMGKKIFEESGREIILIRIEKHFQECFELKLTGLEAGLKTNTPVKADYR